MRRDAFGPDEQDYYEALYTQSQAQFGTYVEAGTLLNNYAHIFDLLIRLRQAVNHPYLVIFSHTANNDNGDGKEDAAARKAVEHLEEKARGKRPLDANDGDDTPSGRIIAFPSVSPHAGAVSYCGLCHDPAEDPLAAACGHIFCRICVVEFIGGALAGSVAACPSCSKSLTIDLGHDTIPGVPSAGGSGMKQQAYGRKAAAVHRSTPTAGGGPAANVSLHKQSILSRIDLSKFQSSTKIEALREELSMMMSMDPSSKAIVFSQFTSMLDLCAFRLEQTGIKCVRLHGSMSMDARTKAIDKFTNDPDARVFLMSLKAGGVALNLTAASHCFVLDSWWNPATEWQAMDRIHRLGQYKPMRCVKFVISGTIEERIVKLQEKKRLVFEATVGGDAEALGRLTEDDMKFLFN